LALHPRCSGPDGKFRKTAPTFRFNQENLSQTKGGSRQIETEKKKNPTKIEEAIYFRCFVRKCKFP